MVNVLRGGPVPSIESGVAEFHNGQDAGYRAADLGVPDEDDLPPPPEELLARVIVHTSV